VRVIGSQLIASGVKVAGLRSSQEETLPSQHRPKGSNLQQDLTSFKDIGSAGDSLHESMVQRHGLMPAWCFAPSVAKGGVCDRTDHSMRVDMKAFLTSIVSLYMLMASLLIQSPVMALSTHSSQSLPIMGVQSSSIMAATKDADDQLQATIGSVTGEGGQQTKKGTKQRQADGKEVDRTAKALVKEDASNVTKATE
jgi:hypothetical protein